MNTRFLPKLISLASLGLILTQPTAASTVVAEDAVVYNHLPSNVRVEPNGRIICQIRKKTTISVYHFTNGAVPTAGSPSNGWYLTNACGTNHMGWIYKSQIKLTGKTHSAP